MDAAIEQLARYPVVRRTAWFFDDTDMELQLINSAIDKLRAAFGNKSIGLARLT
jgi:hypothetical protein